jgi:hypothetical protein
MCAYNVRANKRIDHDAPTREERHHDLVREVGIWVIGLTAMYLVFLLAKRFLL